MTHSDDQENAPTLFDTLGGEARVRELVDRFYDLMDLEPEFAGPARACTRRRWTARATSCSGSCPAGCGGPDHYIERFGHPRLRARHLPFAIGTPSNATSGCAAWRWPCMNSACDDALRERLMASFFQTADWMRNREG